MATPLMKCGHAAQGIETPTSKPACVICGVTEVDPNPPDLKERSAQCSYFNHCSSVENSSFDLAFFEYRPKDKRDIFYCGCLGWD